MLSYLESDRSSPEVVDASSKESCRHFSLPWYTLYVNVKLSKACAELKITYQLYGLSIRNPIRKARIAEPLYFLCSFRFDREACYTHVAVLASRRIVMSKIQEDYREVESLLPLDHYW